MGVSVVMRGLVPRINRRWRHNAVWAPEPVDPRDEPAGDEGRRLVTNPLALVMGVSVVMRGLVPRINRWRPHDATGATP